jgi:hypothetical protein
VGTLAQRLRDEVIANAHMIASGALKLPRGRIGNRAMGRDIAGSWDWIGRSLLAVAAILLILVALFGWLQKRCSHSVAGVEKL